MDHVMDFIREYMWESIQNLKNENESGKYNKLSECPSYEEVKAYCESYNTLVRYYYDDNCKKQVLISPSKLVRGW